jgi:predicted GNAT superfamily acetyltransferase
MEIRALRTGAEMSAASAVYQRAFGYAPGEAAIPPKLLMTLGQHGGLVLGAFEGGELVGFNYAFLARDPMPPGTPPGELYLFSQSTSVVPEAQSTGVGRLLKWAQRDHALAAGIDLIRWTFDPLRARNAHLNFDVLGASAGTLLVDYYGVDTVGRDAGAASDRLLADWHLTAPAAQPPTQAEPAGPAAPAGPEPTGVRLGAQVGEWLGIPADWDAYRARAGDAAAGELRLAVRAALGDAFAAGRRAVSCRRVDAGLAAYRLL